MAAPNPFELFNPQFNKLKDQKVGAKTFYGHTDAVCSLAIAQSGELLSGSWDDTIKVWDLKSGQCLKTLEGHTSWVSCLAIAPSGELISGSFDDTIKVWDLKSGQRLKTLEGHTGQVYCLAFAPSGDLVSGSEDKTIKVWDLKSGECLKTFSGHTSFVYCLAIAPSGKLVSGSTDITIKVWDLKSSQCLKTLEGHIHWVKCLAIAPSGELVSGSFDSTIKVWDLKSGQCLKTLEGHTSWVECLAIAPSGELVSGSADNTIQVWDLKSGQCLKTLAGHEKSVYAVTFLPSGDLVSGSMDNTIKVWATSEYLVDNKIVQKQDRPLPVMENGMAAPQQPLVLHKPIAIPAPAPAPAASPIKVGVKTLPGHAGYVSCLAIAQSGELVSGSDDNTIKVWDPSELIADNKLMQKQDASNIQPLPVMENGMAAPQQSLVLHKPIAIPAPVPAPAPIKAPVKPEFASSYTVNYQDLKFGKELGKGTFGIVYQGIWRHNDVAIKQLLVNNLSSDATDEFKAETAIMARLHSPNIVQLYGCCFNPHYCIVMEYMPKGSLFNVLHSKQDLTWSNRIRIAVDMAKGLAFLHQEHILHRDIKSLNVLLGEHFNAKLSDFGLSKAKTETQSTSTSKGAVGTFAWMAPELCFEEEGCTKASDIYSLGITLWELTSRKIPFKKVAKPALIPMKAQQGVRDEIPADCPAKLASLIRACWETEPAKRPDADEVASFLYSDKEDFNQFLPAFRGGKAASSSGYEDKNSALVSAAAANGNGNGRQNNLNPPMPHRGAGVG